MGIPGEHRGVVARDLEQVLSTGIGTGLSEGQLLRRFVAGRDESAFSTLVSRHGPMVMGVCRRILGTTGDADDAFQATFLVLLRRASALQDVDCLGPWLYGVAWRVASRARADSARRRLEEEKAATARPERAGPGLLADQSELSAVLDEEISKLPDKYRRPIVLCYLEGLTQDVAARRLRWKAGVLRGRLDRARRSTTRPTGSTGLRPCGNIGRHRIAAATRAGRRSRRTCHRNVRRGGPRPDGGQGGRGRRHVISLRGWPALSYADKPCAGLPSPPSWSSPAPSHLPH